MRLMWTRSTTAARSWSACCWCRWWPSSRCRASCRVSRRSPRTTAWHFTGWGWCSSWAATRRSGPWWRRWTSSICGPSASWTGCSAPPSSRCGSSGTRRCSSGSAAPCRPAMGRPVMCRRTWSQGLSTTSSASRCPSTCATLSPRCAPRRPQAPCPRRCGARHRLVASWRRAVRPPAYPSACASGSSRASMSARRASSASSTSASTGAIPRLWGSWRARGSARAAAARASRRSRSRTPCT
mmetsp:Transcript_29000/g.77409  ORF Transcript_29000/g.77409 Transcript_29000/m.77409 type:complete len:240 (-) Transcript_29000:2289-3008(-)